MARGDDRVALVMCRMRAIVAVGIVAACGGKKEPAPAAAPARDAAVALDAVAAPIDGAPAIDAAAIDAAAIDAAVARAAPLGAFVIVATDEKTGKPMAATVGREAALQALAGTRLELRDERGRVCEATIGPVMPREGCQRWYPTPVAELVELSGPCGAAFYGVPPGTTLATVKVSKATRELELAAEAVFDEGTGRMAAEKQQLEGLDRAAEIVSTRVLRRDGARGLVLVYSLVHGHRTIDVFELATDDPVTVRDLDSVRAPAPSRVVGADLDGDGVLDAIIAHDAGAAVVYGNGDAVEIECG